MSKRCRDAVATHLADPTLGFNQTLDQCLQQPEYQSLEPFVIDWGANSTNFFVGQISPEDLAEAEAVSYPCLRLWSEFGTNDNSQKFAIFAGRVDVFLAFDLSWHSGVRDLETLADAVEDAMVRTFNEPAAQTWHPDVVYNGTISWRRSPVVKEGAEGWRQTIIFQLGFDVVSSVN
jgi:hypothetical protein